MDPCYSLCRELLTAVAEAHPDLIGDVASLLKRLSPRRHGPGFSSVLWDGTHYTFSAAQSKIVAVLWRAHQRRTPEVRQELLLEAAGSESAHLRDLFRDHAGWAVLIVPGIAKGTFRLPI